VQRATTVWSWAPAVLAVDTAALDRLLAPGFALVTMDTTEARRPSRLGALAGGLTFRDISAGREYTCAVSTGNAAYCWGNTGGGRLGTGP
jgi:hypothetical protein